jgi:hypothetical protein
MPRHAPSSLYAPSACSWGQHVLAVLSKTTKQLFPPPVQQWFALLFTQACLRAQVPAYLVCCVDSTLSAAELPPHAVGASSSECRCKPGYGSITGSAPCRLCPVGTYSEGWTMEDCKPCKFGYTSAVGSESAQQCEPSPQACPIGQWAPGSAVAAAQCLCYPGESECIWLGFQQSVWYHVCRAFLTAANHALLKEALVVLLC